MNRGKICISVCAETADELFRGIDEARGLADVVEVRFDCHSSAERQDLLERIVSLEPGVRSKILATLRPPEQGGMRAASIEERLEFWNSGIGRQIWGADLEEDIIGRVSERPANTVASFHHLSDRPCSVDTAYDRLAATDADVIKIAVQADDITDTIAVWRLLERARADGRNLVPIAIGEPGKWLRILSLAHGAYMSYASLAQGSETAPGQIVAGDLINVYRARQLTTSTGVYGLIAGDTSYSVSPYIHNAAFAASEMDSVFVPLQVRDLDGFFKRMVRPETREAELNFRGFAVTNPHKRSVIPYLAAVDETAEKIGAVNTVYFRGGKMLGTNTDAAGFIEPLKRRMGSLSGARAAVVGAGGAARACVYALKAEKADVTVFARDTAKARALGEEFGAGSETLSTGDKFPSDLGGFDIIVNATPLGTRGSLQNSAIAAAEQMRGVRLVYDLLYNPEETLLIREARAAGAETLGGIEMLIEQAGMQFGIWTGEDPPLDKMAAAVRGRID